MNEWRWGSGFHPKPSNAVSQSTVSEWVGEWVGGCQFLSSVFKTDTVSQWSVNHWVSEWVSEWVSGEWMVSRLGDHWVLIDWLVDWLIDWPLGMVNYNVLQANDWLTDWLNRQWVNEWVSGRSEWECEWRRWSNHWRGFYSIPIIGVHWTLEVSER